MKTGDMCPVCEVGTVSRKVVAEVFKYKGHEITVPDYVIFECSECGEAVVEKESLKASEKIFRREKQKIDGFLSADDIKRIRKSLGYTQSDLGKILGLGAKSFARYENSLLTPSRPVDNLLRILDKYPHSLAAIHPGHGVSAAKVSYNPFLIASDHLTRVIVNMKNFIHGGEFANAEI